MWNVSTINQKHSYINTSLNIRKLFYHFPPLMMSDFNLKCRALLPSTQVTMVTRVTEGPLYWVLTLDSSNLLPVNRVRPPPDPRPLTPGHVLYSEAVLRCVYETTNCLQRFTSSQGHVVIAFLHSRYWRTTLHVYLLLFNYSVFTSGTYCVDFSTTSSVWKWVLCIEITGAAHVHRQPQQ